MKKIYIIISLFVIVFGAISCDQFFGSNEKLPIEFEEIEKYSIYDYITQNQEQYSDFLQILQRTGLDKTLSAYNPHSDGYTLFLPDNAAIDSFLAQNGTYTTLEQLLNDEDYLWYFARYHVVDKSIRSDDFPFGALSDLTLTEDYLAISFVIETDSSYYKVNNQAPVIREDIEMNNGFIHLIKVALSPVTATAYSWLDDHKNMGFSIFKNAVDATGLVSLLSQNPKTDESKTSFTLFVEHDSIFAKRNIHSFAQLAEWISPGRADYNNPLNPLYNFVAYHILVDYMFLDDFSTRSSNFSTYSDVPVHINGTGMDIMINRYKEIFDTIVDGPGDTTFINFVGVNYDASNVMTQSGVIHFIDQVMRQQTPSVSLQTYEVYDRPFFDEYALEAGEYLIEDTSEMNAISYSGSELTYVKQTEDEAPNGLWSTDYIFMEGDFTISFRIPKLVQGTYRLLINADTFNDNNAVVEIFIDGKPIGGSVDLANGINSSSSAPFEQIELGEMTFTRYEAHTVTIRTLIPGTFSWDYIRFDPDLQN